MYCPDSILINNRFLYLKIATAGDFNCRRDIPRGHWFNLLRYSATLFPMSGRWQLRINYNSKYRLAVENYIYRLKTKIGAVRARW